MAIQKCSDDGFITPETRYEARGRNVYDVLLQRVVAECTSGEIATYEVGEWIDEDYRTIDGVAYDEGEIEGMCEREIEYYERAVAREGMALH